MPTFLGGLGSGLGTELTEALAKDLRLRTLEPNKLYEGMTEQDKINFNMMQSELAANEGLIDPNITSVKGYANRLGDPNMKVGESELKAMYDLGVLDPNIREQIDLTGKYETKPTTSEDVKLIDTTKFTDKEMEDFNKTYNNGIKSPKGIYKVKEKTSVSQSPDVMYGEMKLGDGITLNPRGIKSNKIVSKENSIVSYTKPSSRLTAAEKETFKSEINLKEKTINGLKFSIDNNKPFQESRQKLKQLYQERASLLNTANNLYNNKNKDDYNSSDKKMITKKIEDINTKIDTEQKNSMDLLSKITPYGNLSARTNENSETIIDIPTEGNATFSYMRNGVSKTIKRPLYVSYNTVNNTIDYSTPRVQSNDGKDFIDVRKVRDYNKIDEIIGEPTGD